MNNKAMEMVLTKVDEAEVTNKDESYFSHDDETRVLKTRRELYEYLYFRDTHDQFAVPYINTEVRIVGVDVDKHGNPRSLLNQDIRDRNDIQEASDEVLDEAGVTNGLVAGFPMDNKKVAYPVMFTAINDLCARSGLYGPTMLNIFPKKTKDVLSGALRGQFFSEGLKLNKEQTNILVRDGKVVRFKSEHYEDLNAAEGIYEVEKYLKEEFPDFDYETTQVSEEFLLVEYWLNDDLEEDSLKQALENIGIKADKVRILLRFTTSDVGNSAMRVTPVFEVDGTKLALKPSAAVEHLEGNTVSMLAEGMMKNFATSFCEMEDKIEELGNTQVKHVAGCFKHMAKKLNVFSADAIKAKVALLKDTSGTAADVYVALNEVATSVMLNKSNVAEYIKISESVAKMLFADYSRYDKPLTDDDED